MVIAAADILVEVSPAEIRAALMDKDGRLAQFFVERTHRQSLVGGVYSGRVTALDKVSDGAFVDIGLDKPAYLPRAKNVTEGQIFIAQVVRDGWAGKGAVLTRTPVLQGRYVSFQAQGKGVQAERGFGKGRLVSEVEKVLGEQTAGRVTIRRPALKIAADVILGELAALRASWEAVASSAATGKSATCLLPAPDLMMRLLRDQMPTEEIYVDGREIFIAMKRTIGDHYPDLKGKLAFYDREAPLFEESGVEDQLATALERTVTLGNGSRLIFDETEALIAIDIDSGGIGGGPDGVRRANVAAMGDIAKQLILRNLAGLIVIDPISMSNRGHRKQVVDALRQAIRFDDRAVDVLGMGPAGLIEMTRQRSGLSLGAQLLNPPQLSATHSAESDAASLLRKALRLSGPGRPVAVVPPKIAAALQGPLEGALAQTGRLLGQDLEIRADAAKKLPEVFLER
jgi:ribonuclease G